MRVKRIAGYQIAMVGLGLLASTVSWAEDVKVNILKLRNDKPTGLYNCADGQQVVPAWTPERFPWPAVASNPPSAWIQVTVTGKDGRPNKYCVKDYAVVTDHPAKVAAECGGVGTQRSASTRAMGENCKPKP